MVGFKFEFGCWFNADFFVRFDLGVGFIDYDWVGDCGLGIGLI